MNSVFYKPALEKQVGFPFQFCNLIPKLNVGENIEVVLNISHALLSVDEILAAVEMQAKKGRFPRELSGGEQQHISITRAVGKNPKLLQCRG